MSMSVGSAFIMALVIIIGLAAFIFIPMWAGRRPFFKQAKPRKPHQKVTGGVHQGDPRSVAPHRDEAVPPPQDESASAEDQAGPGQGDTAPSRRR